MLNEKTKPNDNDKAEPHEVVKLSGGLGAFLNLMNK